MIPGRTSSRAPDISEEVPVVSGQRPWTDQGHVAQQHIDQLRQLVDRGAPQELADLEDPRIILDLE